MTVRVVPAAERLIVVISSSGDVDRHIIMISSSCDSEFIHPKRRFWKAEQTFGNAFSKHFSNERQIEYSTMWETTFPRNSHAGLGKPF